MRHPAGFSLVEILVVIALVAITLSFSIPGFSALRQRSYRAAAVNELVSHLNFARHTALQQGEEIIVCPSSDSSQCAHGRTWINGWITWANRDRDNPPVRDDNEPLLRVASAVNGGLSLNANRDRFAFRPFGGAINGTWVVCDSRNQTRGLAIIVSTAGRVRLSPTMADGSVLNCAAN